MNQQDRDTRSGRRRLSFIVPDRLEFPVIERNRATGKVHIDPRALEVARSQNEHIDWDEPGTTLIFVMAWYEMLRGDGFRDVIAEVIRSQNRTQHLLVDARRVALGESPKRHQ